MNKLYTIILTTVFISFSLGQDTLRFQYMSNKDIDSLLTNSAKKSETISSRINFYSELFLGMPYNLHCAGDGPYALYEPWPLVNFRETNCMLLCEHVLALAISDSWDNFFNNLQQIRYKDGMIGMRTRNHYTMADWLPENSWLLQDVSRRVGAEYTKSVTRTISHKNFFAGKGITDMRDVIDDRAITIDYVPFQDLDKVKDRIKTGDVLSLILADKKNIFSAHMMLIAERNGKLFIRESALSQKTTLDTSYDEWIKGERFKSGRYIGLAFMRVRDELNTKGRIIKPWEINGLKCKK